MEGKKDEGPENLEELTFGHLHKDNTFQPDAKRNSVYRQDKSRLACVCWQLFRHRGVVFVFFGALCSALHSVFVRYIKDDVHTTEIAFIRFLLQFFFALPVLTYSRISPKPESKTVLKLLLARGIIGTTALTSFFFSLQYTSVGNATGIVFGSPVFVGFFARIFLKEAFGVFDFVLVVIVIVGVFLISQPPFLFGGTDGEYHGKQYIGALFALFTCILMSLGYIFVGKLGKLHVNAFKIVIYYAALGTTGSAFLTTIFQVWSIPSCGTVRFALIGMGVLNFISQCLITYSLSIERSIFVSILRGNEIIFAYVLEYLFFGATPSFFPLIGVGLVLSGSIAASLKKMWLSRKKGVAKQRQSQLSNSIVMERTL